MACAVCKSEDIKVHAKIDGYTYFECIECGTLQLDEETINDIDNGKIITREYDEDYWARELKSAKERSYGSSLARVAELFLYARRPINRFVDIGTGPGYLLDALTSYLPSSKEKFYACEKFPPSDHSKNDNYFLGYLGEMPGEFDAGVCIEVVEHLTPKMLSNLAKDLAEKSVENSIFLFNTGLPDYVKRENPNYLDPVVRGHIVSYSIKGLQTIFEPYGFKVYPIAGKSWAFIVEYKPTEDLPNMEARIWSAQPENTKTLNDPEKGNILWILGLETARAYK